MFNSFYVHIYYQDKTASIFLPIPDILLTHVYFFIYIPRGKHTLMLWTVILFNCWTENNRCHLPSYLLYVPSILSADAYFFYSFISLQRIKICLAAMKLWSTKTIRRILTLSSCCQNVYSSFTLSLFLTLRKLKANLDSTKYCPLSWF